MANEFQFVNLLLLSVYLPLYIEGRLILDSWSKKTSDLKQLFSIESRHFKDGKSFSH